MTDIPSSKENARDRWRSFKRAEAAMWHATMIHRGAATDSKTVIKTAQEIRKYFDACYSDAKLISDANIKLRAQVKEARSAL